LQEAGRAALEAGVKAAGYSGLTDQRLNGLDASVQVIQLGERGSALYNVRDTLFLYITGVEHMLTPTQCADIRFNSTATLLADDKCVNGTGVGGTSIGNLQGNAAASPTGSAAPAQSSGAAARMGSSVGGGVFAAVVAWGLL
jgi:hypothetical protein